MNLDTTNPNGRGERSRSPQGVVSHVRYGPRGCSPPGTLAAALAPSGKRLQFSLHDMQLNHKTPHRLASDRPFGL
jgi:hypothetical protein